MLAFDVWSAYGTWGTPALSTGNDSQRETQLYPGKSAIAGILGAASGVDRRDLPAFAAKIRVGCRTDAVPVRQAPDYEAIQRSTPRKMGKSNEDVARRTRFEDLRAYSALNKGSKGGSILSTREYWSSGGWSIFVSASEDILNSLFAALKMPVYPVYAGRRSCPFAFPMVPVLMDTTELSRAVKDYLPLQKRMTDPVLLETIQKWRTTPNGMLYWEDGFPGAPAAMTRRLVRQRPMPIPRNDGSARHLLRLFGEYVECSAPTFNT